MDDTANENDIMDQFKVSKRTLQYDVKAINDWLCRQKLHELERTSEGVLVWEATKLVRDQLLADVQDQSIPFHQMSEMDRRDFLLFILLIETDYVSTKELCDRFDMSRNSIRKLLVDLETSLAGEDIQLLSKPKKGWILWGEEDALKRFFVKRFHEVFIERTNRYRFQRREMHELVSQSIPGWQSWLAQRSHLVAQGVTDRSSGRVIASLMISILRADQTDPESTDSLEFPVLAESGVLQRFESLIEGHDFPLSEKDHVFCAKYLLGNRAIDMDQKLEIVFDELPKMVKTMVKDMSEISARPIRDPERLVKSLIAHLQPTIFRIRFGIEVENELLGQIQERYQAYYRAARIASRPLEQHFSIRIPPEEVAFIAMHFGAFIEKEQRDQARILLVCHEGMATVRLIQARLQEEFDAYSIIGIKSRHQYMNMKTIEADLVVTTIYLESRGIPVVSVEPLLSEENIKDLGKVLAKRTVPREDAVDRILAEVEKFSTIHQPKLMRQAIRAIVEGKRSGKKLSELLNTSHILLGQRVDSWQEAVGLAAQPLLTDGAITEGYYLRMLENIERFRAYVVIKKFVAMPHARPEDGALDLQASLVVLDKGVKFGHPKNDPVRIVFILTAIDPQQHLQALDTFRKMIATDEALKRLKQMQSKEACRQWIMELEE
jgi:transcriptional antiterminator/mannitol/fructose-specific phosphotransferase system IIA component (Ntr-type)